MTPSAFMPRRRGDELGSMTSSGTGPDRLPNRTVLASASTSSAQRCRISLLEAVQQSEHAQQRPVRVSISTGSPATEQGALLVKADGMPGEAAGPGDGQAAGGLGQDDLLGAGDLFGRFSVNPPPEGGMDFAGDIVLDISSQHGVLVSRRIRPSPRLRTPTPPSSTLRACSPPGSSEQTEPTGVQASWDFLASRSGRQLWNAEMRREPLQPNELGLIIRPGFCLAKGIDAQDLLLLILCASDLMVQAERKSSPSCLLPEERADLSRDDP